MRKRIGLSAIVIATITSMASCKGTGTADPPQAPAASRTGQIEQGHGHGGAAREWEIAGAGPVSDEELRRYYDDHAAQLRTELHVERILRRSRPAIDEAAGALAAGTPFEQVALADLPVTPTPGERPYDLGFLKWIQLPEAVREAAWAMKPGEVSGVLAGAGDRFWIVRLVGRREDPKLTFEAMRPLLVEVLRGQKVAYHPSGQ